MILISFFDKDVYMEQQIQDLIDSIRKEGLDKANSEKERIIDGAKAQRDEILRSAEEEKERIIKEAEKKAELLESSARASIQQAARNASLSLKNEIESRITAILKAECRKALSLPELAGIIKAAVAADVSGKNIELPSSVFDSLGDNLKKEFADEIRNGLEIKPSSAASGFRISEKDGSGYVDYSDEECTRLILPYLSDALKEILG